MSTFSKTLSYTTDSSFLRRVKIGDELAWKDFYKKYSGMIRNIGKKRNLNADDCDDLMIEVMTIFWKKMDHFVYDPQRGRFRSYLSKIAEFCAMRRFADKCRNVEMVPENIEYPPDIDATFLEEWQNFLLQRALDDLKNMVETVTFQVFYMSYFQNRPVDEICEITRKTANNVYGIRFRCLKKLRDLINGYRQLGEAELLRHWHKNMEEN